MIKYQQLKLRPGYTMREVMQKIADNLRIADSDIRNLVILRESIDARRKPDIFYILSVAFSCNREEKLLAKYGKKYDLSIYQEKRIHFPEITRKKGAGKRPVVIGTGPAGLFCGYYLSRAGLKPILLERGKAVEERIKDVEAFWNGGKLMPDSNVQFGEGGAGTFSDGKLNTLNKDPFGYQREVLELFVKMGADPAISYEQKPHVGTDQLIAIVKNLRSEILRLGGEVCFETKVTEFLTEETPDGKRICGVCTENGNRIDTDKVVLAIGHSARDTFEVLYRTGFAMEAKEFAVGYRVQHKQRTIDISQYGEENLGKLPPAPYKLTARAKDGRGVYSFCMCPGGYVVNSSSEEGGLCINGMSYRDRGSENANSAIIVSVTPKDFGTENPLSGVYFQRELEKRAYDKGNGRIPVQRLVDFQNDTVTDKEGAIAPIMKGQYACANLRGILPEYLETAFLEGMEQFEHKIPGFSDDDTIVAGIEARTSSPVRINRDKRCEAIHIKGVYPCGEGAGYAGGITSAATDGLRVALMLMEDLGGEEK